MRRFPAAAVLATAAGPARGFSEAAGTQPAWRDGAPRYPPARSAYPLARPRFRKTHIEWMLHHGHGDRHSKYGPSREIADFEYADGTPAAATPRRFAYKHHQDHLLVQLIRAGALVERYEAAELLPRVPGTPEQRNWDPEIPLFLEDADERGRPPVSPTSRDALNRLVDARLGDTAKPSANVANAHAGEELTPNTMFAAYDPAAFVSDNIRADARRPYWSRRRWALSDNFMVPVSPKPKNTIPDE